MRIAGHARWIEVGAAVTGDAGHTGRAVAVLATDHQRLMQLHAIGLPELVTTSLAEYEALALRLAREPASLAALRAKLAANRHTHPLFDMARYTRDFEALLLRTWDEHHRL